MMNKEKNEELPFDVALDFFNASFTKSEDGQALRDAFSTILWLYKDAVIAAYDKDITIMQLTLEKKEK